MMATVDRTLDRSLPWFSLHCAAVSCAVYCWCESGSRCPWRVQRLRLAAPPGPPRTVGPDEAPLDLVQVPPATVVTTDVDLVQIPASPCPAPPSTTMRHRETQPLPHARACT